MPRGRTAKTISLKHEHPPGDATMTGKDIVVRVYRGRGRWTRVELNFEVGHFVVKNYASKETMRKAFRITGRGFTPKKVV